MRNFFLLKSRNLDACKGFCGSSKRFFFLLAMVFMVTGNALAEVIDGLNYILDSDTKTATLTADTEEYSGDIVVPESVLAKDNISYTVTRFGDYCFNSCRNLTSVSIPSTVTSLGDRCFMSCINLTSINIPSSVTSLGENCFYDCTNLASINVPSSVTVMGDRCFFGCKSLTSIELPSSITVLGDACFRSCSSLTSVSLPSAVTSLGERCFYECYSLTSITIPSTVTWLDEYCFAYSGLTSVILPSSVKIMGDGCFTECADLTSITLSPSLTSLGESCFWGCTSLASITIPSSVTSLGEECFAECNALASVTLSSSLETVEDYCFENCNSLATITIPSSVTTLGEGCFDGCSSLATMYFEGNNPQGIGEASIATTCIIYVLDEYLQNYKDALGAEYNINTWIPEGEGGGDDKPEVKCATPTISYEAGKLMFACDTEGAKYHYTISNPDVAADVLNENGEVALSATYKITVYATADGFLPSESSEASLHWLNADMETTTDLNPTKTRGIMVSTHDGTVSISGLGNGEAVKFYSADGRLVGSTTAINGCASYAVSEPLVVAKVGDSSIKIVVK